MNSRLRAGFAQPAFASRTQHRESVISLFFSLLTSLRALYSKNKKVEVERAAADRIRAASREFFHFLSVPLPSHRRRHHCTDACVHPDAVREGGASSTENGRGGGEGLAKCESRKAKKRGGGVSYIRAIVPLLLLPVTFRYAATRLGPSSYGPPSRRQCNRLWACVEIWACTMERHKANTGPRPPRKKKAK